MPFACKTRWVCPAFEGGETLLVCANVKSTSSVLQSFSLAFVFFQRTLLYLFICVTCCKITTYATWPAVRGLLTMSAARQGLKFTGHPECMHFLMEQFCLKSHRFILLLFERWVVRIQVGTSTSCQLYHFIPQPFSDKHRDSAVKWVTAVPMTKSYVAVRRSTV